MAQTIEDIEYEIRSLSADDRMHLLRDLIADLDGSWINRRAYGIKAENI